jgi:hypothetical protein
MTYNAAVTGISPKDVKDYSSHATMWRGVGTWADDAALAEDGTALLDRAGMLRPVYTRPLYYADDAGGYVETDSLAIGADYDDGFHQYGAVKGRYEILQNLDFVLRTMQPLVDANLCRYAAAGNLKGGARAWVAAELSSGIVRENPDGSPDRIYRHLMGVVGHDGRTAVYFSLADMRLVCSNVIASAMEGGITIRFKHDSGLMVNVGEAANRLAEVNRNFAATIDAYKAMAALPLTSKRLDALYTLALPIRRDPDTDAEIASPRRAKIIAESARLMVEGSGAGGGTVWDWYNGVTEFLDHEGDHRGKHFESSLWGVRSEIRRSAYDAAMSVLRAA